MRLAEVLWQVWRRCLPLHRGQPSDNLGSAAFSDSVSFATAAAVAKGIVEVGAAITGCPPTIDFHRCCIKSLVPGKSNPAIALDSSVLSTLAARDIAWFPPVGHVSTAGALLASTALRIDRGGNDVTEPDGSFCSGECGMALR